ncbi:MAG: hypothetical protein M3Y13_12105, partial [Armatimonadota bacterium]|nr:hypothetical protein [Armatimonadota bacterium]
NDWQGDYNPTTTGLGQNYTSGPADLAAAHTYLSNPHQRPVDVLNQLRSLARLTTPGKAVAHTEFGAYAGTNLTTRTFGQYLVMGAFDSAAAGDAAYLVYGLQDSGPEHSYGFFTFPANSPHEAATYFHTMTTILKSARGGYGPGMLKTFTPGSLSASFSNPSVSHLLLQKPTGEFVLATWSEQLMDGKQHPDTDTVYFGRTFSTLRVYDIETGTTPLTVLHHVSRYSLRMKLSDTYLLVMDNGKTLRRSARQPSH